MERPPKKYVCEKCGYLGNTSEHEGCDYLAWTTGEQLYIDQLEAELAALRASPASAPEDVIDAVAIALRKAFQLGQTYWQQADSDYISQNKKSDDTYAKFLVLSEEISALLAAAPTPPVSEDRWLPIETAPKDEFVLLAGPSGYTTIETVFATGRMCSDYHVGRWIDHANDDLTDWGFEPTHWTPLPKAPAMQEDKP